MYTGAAGIRECGFFLLEFDIVLRYYLYLYWLQFFPFYFIYKYFMLPYRPTQCRIFDNKCIKKIRNEPEFN